MIKSAVAVLTLATAVFAQSTTQSAASGIPTGLSTTCTTFLSGLNRDTTINGCLTALIDATSDFDPSTSGGHVSPTVVTSALNTICAPTFHSCPETNIRSMLANFYTACSTDMLGTNGDGSNGRQDVISIYDVLYLIIPLNNAICTKDNGQYCVNVIANGNSPSTGSSSVAPSGSDSGAAPSGTSPAADPSASSAPAESSASSSASSPGSSSASSSAASPSASTHARRSFPASSLYKRVNSNLPRADNTTGQETLGTVAPEAAQYNTLGLPYLFITSNFTTDELCTHCTSEVIGSYISFESVTPYALGIANSPMLSGQVALWNRIKDCPGDYASALLNNATGTTASGAFASVQFGITQLVGAFVVAVFGGAMLF